MLNVVMVEAGNYCGLGERYVHTLIDMITRNLSKPVNFILYSDSEYSIKGVECRKLPDDLNGWWNKLYMFKDCTQGEYFYLDLDTIVLGDLYSLDVSSFWNFVMLEDFYEPGILASGLMFWRGDHSYIWDNWLKAGKPIYKSGDQHWIGQQVMDFSQAFQELFPGKIKSFKKDSQILYPDEDTLIVCFHGKPRPHEVKGGWVPHFWEIGGLAKPIFVSKVNTSDDELFTNIDYSSKLGINTLTKPSEAHDKKLIIVGGGPSLKENIELINQMQVEQDYDVWTLNGTYNYLVKNGIQPNAFVMLDAREENAAFVQDCSIHTTYYISSQCHPSVFDHLLSKGMNVVLWHSSCKYTETSGNLILHGGSTVGLRALSLAFVLGYRDVSLIGYDSSYKAGENHAYKQPLNDNEKRINIVVKGREFDTAVWMARQTQLALTQIPYLINSGMKITIFGDGLLPWAMFVNQEMAQLPKQLKKEP